MKDEDVDQYITKEVLIAAQTRYPAATKSDLLYLLRAVLPEILVRHEREILHGRAMEKG